MRGDIFEEEVAEIFELLGYRVKRNLILCGQQIDIYREFTLPSRRVARTIVECKYREKENIGNDVVNDFCGAFLNAQKQNLAEYGMIITNRDFTNTAKLAASNAGIELMTYNELLSNLIDFKDYLSRIIYDFENYDKLIEINKGFMIDVMERCNLYKYYVPLSCKFGLNVNCDLKSMVLDWLKDPTGNHLSILGDYGTGKSSFCIYLTYVLAKQCLEEPVKMRVPIFISLKDYGKAVSIEQLITHLFVNKYNIKMNSYAVFERLLETDMLLLIFDGFDEMATKSSKRITFENFNSISELASGQTKVILTCQTHYFQTRVAEEEIFSNQPSTEIGRLVKSRANFKIVYLEEFDEKKIQIFLKKHTTEWLNIWEKIKSTYNLEDLAKRPILLEMILKTVGKIKDRKNIDICDLYKFYTDIWIEREDWHSVMSREGKRLFMENLAMQMYKVDKHKEDYSIHYSQLPKPIKEYFNEEIVTRDDLDYYDHDTRTCSFLNRTVNGHYKFIHKSFMEYFLACKIAREAMARRFDILDSIKVSVEIIEFLQPQISNDEIKIQLLTEIFIKNGWPTFESVFKWDVPWCDPQKLYHCRLEGIR